MSYDEKHFNEGIIRRKVKDIFIYYYVDNNKEVSKKDLDRIIKLRIPPAWENVWISRDPHSAIQAIGTDSKGRKQYKYGSVHIEKMAKEKFIRMYSFIKSMPKLEKVLIQHNTLPAYDKNRVISLMLQIVRDHHLRVGKEVYAKKNKSYGISSLRKRHVTFGNGVAYLKFKGKSNQRLHYTIKNDFYVKSLKLLMRLSGDRLFQYITTDEYGNDKIMKVSDRDLNKYIQEYMGPEFSIKDFRTFAANKYFIQALLNETKRHTPKNRKVIKKNIMNALKSTARELKHTRAISKKSYILNFAIELYQNNPEYFTENKNANATQLLLELLKLYKKNILSE